MIFQRLLSLCFLFFNISYVWAQEAKIPLPGAYQLTEYLPMIKNKKVAVFANQTSIIGHTHLVDTLMKLDIKIKKIFSPEHGFRGDADAGEHVNNSIDKPTRLPVISLYGDKKKPSKTELADVDVMIFDIQDVGVRYYTFITSLQFYIEAGIENKKTILVLDRPNPNGFYVDGPVLEPSFKSFIGMQQIPIVYGMTMGEYAKMLVGEKLFDPAINTMLEKAKDYSLIIIPCKNYDHNSYYELPMKPSPNLPNMQSVLLYPSICFFEGTEVSLGRGTNQPFQCYGHPSFPNSLYSFTPTSTSGAKNPPLKNKLCYGYDLSELTIDIQKKENRQINLSYILNAYMLFPNKDSFFLRPKKGNPSTADYFFNKLAGNDRLMWQIMNGKSEAEIRQSWEQGLQAFKEIRKKYLLYKDFE